MKRLKAFAVLLSFMLILVSCSTNPKTTPTAQTDNSGNKTTIPAEIDNLVKDLSAGINNKDRQLYMKCIDNENPELYINSFTCFKTLKL